MINYFNLNRAKKYIADPLYRNALLLIASYGVASLSGFLFWLIAARFYTTIEVGLATALVSGVALLGSISKIGFDFGLIRYLPEYQDKTSSINTCFTLTTLISIIAAIVFILGLRFWSPKLLFIEKNGLYFFVFVLFTVLTTMNQLQGNVFIAFRAAHFTFMQSVINGLEPVLVAILTFAGTLGIFLSANLGLVLATALGFLFLLILIPGYRPFPKLSKGIGTEMVRFSFVNYVVGILVALPQYLLPLIIIDLLSAEDSAYYYIAFSIAGIAGMVASVTSSSLLAEGSHEPKDLRNQVVKALKFILPITLSIVIILITLGKPILSLFGKQYTENSLLLLRLMTIGFLPNILSTIYTTVLRVQKKGRPLIFMWSFYSAFSIFINYIMMKEWGIVGLGIAWILSQTVVGLIAGIILLRMFGKSLKKRANEG
jgi:O-antigen/teichoic acid export membrane protein